MSRERLCTVERIDVVAIVVPVVAAEIAVHVSYAGSMTRRVQVGRLETLLPDLIY